MPLSASSSRSQGSEPIFVESCRKCPSDYTFILQNGETITVICGRPDLAIGKYKALSYVWEDAQPVLLHCRECTKSSEVQMRSASKLLAILEFLRGGSRVWIDALSIDQSDPDDKAAQLPVMGDIYRHADTVSVFLLEEDREAYEMLKRLGIVSDEIVKRYDAFAACQTGEELLRLADEFSANVKNWMENLDRWRYWGRAWTFQEWAMAREIEISYEGAPGNEGLANTKNVIFEASTIVAHWRKTTARALSSGTKAENLLQQIHLRDDVGSELSAVRAMFPFEGFLVADNNEDTENLRASTILTPMPIATDSGTYIGPASSTDVAPPLRSMLSLALTAMSTSKRKATHEADLVACWASTCNISYPYDIKDTLALALHKVIFELRERGIRVYNFLANTDSGETDLEFLAYAAAHRQNNASSRGYLFGAPIFVGRADTVTHVLQLLHQKETVTHLPPKKGVMLQQVGKAIFKRPVPWNNNARVMSTFRSIVSGKAEGVRLFDVAEKVGVAIDKLDPTELRKRLLIVVSIGADDVYTMWYCNAWAIIPASTPLQDLFVARESLNGTLVLAVYKAPQRDLTTRPYTRDDPREPATQAQIVAYLNMTHQRDGTYLVKSNDGGVLDIVFRTADTPEHELFWMPENALREMGGEGLIPDWNITGAISDRVLNLKISLEDRFFSLASCEQATRSNL